MRNGRVLISLALVVLTVAVFVVAEVPYGHFHWFNLVWAQDGSTYGGGAGCEIDIPAGSVVGRFGSNATLYWAPSLDTATNYTVGHSDAVPKTAWVIGLDSSKSFYKIIWACQYFWVPSGTIGPNPDAVWQNTPLPASIVE